MSDTDYDPHTHNRRSLRNPDFDYSQSGAYFVTICTQMRVSLLGEVQKGIMHLSEAGVMVQRVWVNIPERFPELELDAYIIMPNHFHGILILTDTSSTGIEIPSVGAPLVGAHVTEDPRHQTLGAIIGAFKSITTTKYITGVRERGWPAFPGKLWQRNYFERVVRNQEELDALAAYINANPAQWDSDENNPMYENW